MTHHKYPGDFIKEQIDIAINTFCLQHPNHSPDIIKIEILTYSEMNNASSPR